MNAENFESGIRHLGIMFGVELAIARKEMYFLRLQDIPNDLWQAGIIRLAETHSYPFFPLIAEIGEACVPGQTETEEADRWTGRWVKTLTPWPVRLAALVQPALIQSASQLQIPGPRDPLSDAEQTLLAQPMFARFREVMVMSRAEQIKKNKAVQASRWREEDASEGSPYVRGHGRDLININSPEAQEVAAYWTPERTEARREVLRQQLLWISRRDKAERNGTTFTELRPV